MAVFDTNLVGVLEGGLAPEDIERREEPAFDADVGWATPIPLDRVFMGDLALNSVIVRLFRCDDVDDVEADLQFGVADKYE